MIQVKCIATWVLVELHEEKYQLWSQKKLMKVIHLGTYITKGEAGCSSIYSTIINIKSCCSRWSLVRLNTFGHAWVQGKMKSKCEYFQVRHDSHDSAIKCADPEATENHPILGTCSITLCVILDINMNTSEAHRHWAKCQTWELPDKEVDKAPYLVYRNKSTEEVVLGLLTLSLSVLQCAENMV